MKSRCAVSIGLIGIVLLFLVVSPVYAAEQGRPTSQEEINGDPLTIRVSSDGTIQVFHSKYPNTGSVYGDPITGASGPFVAINDEVFGSFVPAWAGLQDPIAMTEVDQSGPMGAGSAADPFQVITTLELSSGTYNLRIVQTVSYVNGEDHFQLDWEITNIGGEEACFNFYHAADIFFAGEDEGFGYSDGSVVGGYNRSKDWYMAFEPLTPADHYKESYYVEIWEVISLGEDLDDSIDEEFVDNGIAQEWKVCLGARESTILSDLWRFGDMPPIGGDVDVWLKDSPEDDGSVPSTDNNAAFWTSTDMIVRNEWDDEKIHQNPIRDQENYIYVYVRNRGIEDAEDVTVNVYYADANQLSPRWPDSFHFIDSVVVDVPASEGLWTEEIPWVPPVSGHLCLYVRLESEQDPIRHEGNVPGDNNIAQRNIHVITLPSEGSGTTGTSVDPILSNPSTDPDDQIDLVLQYPDIPDTLRIVVILPEDLFEDWQDLGGYMEGGTVVGTRHIEVNGWGETVFYGLPIAPLDEAQITIVFEGSAEDPFVVSAIERLNGEDIGGNAYYYQGIMSTETPESGSSSTTSSIIQWLTGHCCLSLGILAGIVVVIFLIVFFVIKGTGKQNKS
jgi:hypothetical protein